VAKNAPSRTKRKKRNRIFEQIHLNAGGIDAGASEHWVAIPEDREGDRVRKFGTTTSELYSLADWLVDQKIETVAIEATGVYCVPLMEVLEARGLEVVLVRPSSLKSVNDRQKTDMLDCQWIQTLHTFGLLRASFRPPRQIAELRAYARHRRTLIEQSTTHIQHMQKALTQMNLRLDQVVSDITGETGMRIIRAIVGGETRPDVLSKMRDQRCAKSEEQIAEALFGRPCPEHLLVLDHALQQWEHCRRLIAECDRRIEAHASTFERKAHRQAIPAPRRREHIRKNIFSFDARSLFFELLGVDLTQIDGISTSTICTFLSEVGTDVAQWKSEKHFCSWLRLCPGNNVTGGHSKGGHNRHPTNRLATALRLAAQSLERSDSAMGAFHRRMKARLGPEKAINATAHKLARHLYYAVRDRRTYVDPGSHAYEMRHRERILRHLERRAQSLGFKLVKAA
jgi:transposase